MILDKISEYIDDRSPGFSKVKALIDRTNQEIREAQEKNFLPSTIHGIRLQGQKNINNVIEKVVLDEHGRINESLNKLESIYKSQIAKDLETDYHLRRLEVKYSGMSKGELQTAAAEIIAGKSPLWDPAEIEILRAHVNTRISEDVSVNLKAAMDRQSFNQPWKRLQDGLDIQMMNFLKNRRPGEFPVIISRNGEKEVTAINIRDEII